MLKSRSEKLSIKGQKLLSRGKFQKALEVFQKAVLEEDSPENLFNLALSLTALKDFSRALTYLTKIYRDYPENEINALLLADCYLRLRKWKEAVSVYRCLSARKPDNKNISDYLTRAEDPVAREKYIRGKELLDQAQAEVENKNYSGAVSILKEALDHLPEDPSLLSNLAHLLLKQKKFQEALIFAEKAAVLAPHNDKIKKNLLLIRSKLRH